MWFEQLTGFEEGNRAQVHENLEIEGDSFISKANGRRFTFGQLEVPSLKALRERASTLESLSENICVSEVVAGVEKLHNDPQNAKALFQAASQFNLLEMIGPDITPELGVDRYEYDYTQGPACAIACGAGTIFRNYFVPIDDQLGQTQNKQIDCLDLIGAFFKNEERDLWIMQNGYALISQGGLLAINKILAGLTYDEREELKGLLKVGIQWNTEVTKAKEGHQVTQVYCSALPVRYSHVHEIYWEPFARLILEATYEATLFVALENMKLYGSNLVYLTLVGGGAFGNSMDWILESLELALLKFKRTPLDIRVVSYDSSNLRLVNSLEQMKELIK